MMDVKISTNTDKIFQQYLTIVNTLLSKDKKLTEIEIDVLSKMLYIDNMYKHLPKDKRDKLLFHKETKVKIRESVYNMSTYSYNNIISKLKKKGFITRTSLKTNVPLINNQIDINFILKIEE